MRAGAERELEEKDEKKNETAALHALWLSRSLFNSAQTGFVAFAYILFSFLQLSAHTHARIYICMYVCMYE